MSESTHTKIAGKGLTRLSYFSISIILLAQLAGQKLWTWLWDLSLGVLYEIDIFRRLIEK